MVSALQMRSPAPRANAEDRANSKVQRQQNIASAGHCEAEAVSTWRARHAGGARTYPGRASEPREGHRRTGALSELAEVNRAARVAFQVALTWNCRPARRIRGNPMAEASYEA